MDFDERRGAVKREYATYTHAVLPAFVEDRVELSDEYDTVYALKAMGLHYILSLINQLCLSSGLQLFLLFGYYTH